MLEAESGAGALIHNRYVIQKVLGQGGFGRTYLASNNERFGELCVLKEFLPANRAQYENPKVRELFEREARVLHQINHPQIPKFLAWFTYMGRLFIVQEYIDGQTYAQLLWKRLSQQGQVFSEAEIIQLLRDLLPVLTYIHERHIIHRDISPDNIMLPNNQSLPVLIDFGVVKQTMTQIWAVQSDISSDSGQSLVGKMGYSPIEQIRMGLSYPSSDLYALGVTAIVLLTSKHPDKLMDLKTLKWQWHPYVKVSDQLVRILDKMLEEKVENRYQSAQEVLADLQPFDQPGVVSVTVSVTTPRESFRTETDEVQAGSAVQRWSTLDSAFIDRCRQHLANYVGPMAGFIIEEALDDYPNISTVQLIDALAAEIPNPQKALEFRQRLS